jgi:hypothetical protein
MTKLQTTLEKFDAYNKKDPHVFSWEEIDYPQEYFLALKLYEWVLKLAPDVSEELLLASRSQHIGRWEVPRDSYPDGRDGYLKWRRDLGLYHAGKAAEIMEEAGYNAQQIDRVKQIIQKQKIKVDSEVQVMENALCLVFLEFQYEGFYPKHHADKVINILKKSLLKMDAHGHQHALTLKYSEQGMYFIGEALKLVAGSKK